MAKHISGLILIVSYDFHTTQGDLESNQSVPFTQVRAAAVMLKNELPETLLKSVQECALIDTHNGCSGRTTAQGVLIMDFIHRHSVHLPRRPVSLTGSNSIITTDCLR